MPKSPSSGIEHLTPHQIQADPTINSGFNRLDQSTHGLFTKALTSSDYTLTADEAETSSYLRISGAFSANRALILSNNNDAGTGPRPKHFTVEHSGTGGFTLTFETVSGTGVTLQQNTAQQVYCDGVNVVPEGPVTGAGGQPWDLHLYLSGLPADGTIFYRTKLVRAVRIPAGGTLSLASSEVAATASAVFSLKKGGVQFGTATFALGATTATFTIASNTDFAAGNELRIDAPSPQDATLAGVQFSIAGIKL